MDALVPVATKLIHKSDAAYSNGLRCGGGACPAVYATDQGTFFVVGRRLSEQEKASLAIGAIEDALEIPAELLQAISNKLQG